MTAKYILITAIVRLERINLSLTEKMNKALEEVEKDKYNKEIMRNESMILDYKFRLDHDE